MFKRQIAAAIVAAGTLTLGLVAPAQAADHIVIGASGDHSGLQSHVGHALAEHRFGKLTGPAITSARFVNIETTVAWSQVASGGKDSDLRRWANALKSKGEVWVSWSHEPMAKQNSHWGTASSFIASFKHVVSVFNSAGANNVKWVWNVTSNSFRVKSSSSEYGSKWYPGDSYVDYVAGESYVLCGSSENSFANRVQGILSFAGQHGKKLVVAEFGHKAASTRAAWINAAHSYMDANKGKFAGAFYYNPSGNCMHLSTSAEFSAIRSMVTDAGFGV